MQVEPTGPMPLAEVVAGVMEMLVSVAGELVGGTNGVRVEATHSVAREPGAMHEWTNARFVLTLRGADLEKVVGPRGRTAAALRVIVRAAGLKHGGVFSLSIVGQRSPD